MKETSPRVAVFSNGIPSSTSESFLLRELEVLEVYDDVSLSLVPFSVSPGRIGRRRTCGCHKVPVPLLDPIIPRRASARIPSLRGLWESLSLFRQDLLRQNATLPRQRSAVLKYLVSIYRTAMAHDWIRANARLLENFDTLYFYWGDKGALAIPHIREVFGKLHRIVVRMHGFDLYEERTGGYLPLRKAIFSGADTIVPISMHGARHLTERHGLPASKIVVSRLGVAACDAEDGGPPSASMDSEGPLRIVSCANATAIKRLHLIARAMTFADSAIEWTHIGGGPECENLRRIVDTNGHRNRVSFTGLSVTNVYWNSSGPGDSIFSYQSAGGRVSP
jgi:glycosyltransferase involved in cell wall biosynthesis